MDEIQLYDKMGRRNYLNRQERKAFILAALRQPPLSMTFCLFIYHTGCRISEALERSKENVDTDTGFVTIRSKKKRDVVQYRHIPLPRKYIRHFERIHAFQTAPDQKLWPWSRTTGWRRMKETMEEAGLYGDKACSRGLRHSYGVNGTSKRLDIGAIQKALGHSDIKTTLIYTSVMGPELSQLMNHMWEDEPDY